MGVYLPSVFIALKPASTKASEATRTLSATAQNDSTGFLHNPPRRSFLERRLGTGYMQKSGLPTYPAKWNDSD
jgi:hypothetical protein